MVDADHRHLHDPDNLSLAILFRDPDCCRTNEGINAVLSVFSGFAPFPTSLGDTEGSMKEATRPAKIHIGLYEMERGTLTAVGPDSRL